MNALIGTPPSAPFPSPSGAKVFLCGRDNVRWATDDDYFLTRQALSDIVTFVETPETADVLHAVNWAELKALPVDTLRARKVIAHVPHDVRAMLGQPAYLKIAPYVDLWIGPSRRAFNILSQLGLPTAHVPYIVDRSIFFPLSPSERRQLRNRLGLPESAYLIGSFQRDTEGHDLTSPKLVKGPDVFLEIVRKLHATRRNIHVVLAGPRRMWLKQQLAAAGVPYTFVGTDCGDADDLDANTLAQSRINELYNTIDLYIVASRLEGGPKALLECAAAGTKIIAAEVGHAADVLLPEQIFRTLPQAIALAEADIDRSSLGTLIEDGLATAGRHQTGEIAPLWREIYNTLANATNPIAVNFRPLPNSPPLSWWRRGISRLVGDRICFDYVPRRGPWGGGNQFLTALSSALPRQGWRVRFGHKAGCKVILLNSFHSRLTEGKYTVGKRYIHRIDGPTLLIRGKDIELDQEIFRINDRLANITVMQSEWSLLETLRLGFRPVNPVLLHNAANPDIFFPARDRRQPAGRKLRLISTSWSDNPRKGGCIYKWLDENLDWTRFDYTFVGRVSEPLRNIRVHPPVDSRKLAKILREHDIYITASDQDPCSNALIEAQSCGLPAIYLNRGGHPELVSFGGLGFEHPEEIPALLDTIAADYEAYCRLTTPPALATVAQRYAECFDLASGRNPR